MASLVAAPYPSFYIGEFILSLSYQKLEEEMADFG
jgi:hypothetical protein